MDIDRSSVRQRHGAQATRLAHARPTATRSTGVGAAGFGVHHIVLGDPRHGVTRLAGALVPPGAPRTDLLNAELVTGRGASSPLPSPRRAPVLHLHANDDLLGPTPLEALRAIGAGRRLALTLHDIPQEAEGAERFSRRSALYARLAGAADLVLVLSRHERAGLERLGVTAPVAVVDHPIDAHPSGRPAPGGRTVGMLGWIYPGKGHADVLEAMAAAMPGGTLVAIGGVAPDHVPLVAALARRADALGVQLETTGYVDEDTMLRRAASVAVPVCAHRHVSASGSLGTWATAGRVPVVSDEPFAREVAQRCPGALRLTSDLGAAIRAAAADPATTMLRPGVEVGPSTQEAAARQALVLADWAEQAGR